MARYFDGFVIPIPSRNLAAYRRMARKAGRIWRDHGAVEFKECVGEDLHVKCGPGFRQGIKSKPGETVLFSFIGYKSRAHRDRVNTKVMQDPRIATLGSVEDMPYAGRGTDIPAGPVPLCSGRAGRVGRTTVP